jgi:hypothetical protein
LFLNNFTLAIARQSFADDIGKRSGVSPKAKVDASRNEEKTGAG